MPSAALTGAPIFVTSARHGLDERDPADQPLAGAVFAVPNLAKWLPAHRVGV